VPIVLAMDEISFTVLAERTCSSIQALPPSACRNPDQLPVWMTVLASGNTQISLRFRSHLPSSLS